MMSMIGIAAGVLIVVALIVIILIVGIRVSLLVVTVALIVMTTPLRIARHDCGLVTKRAILCQDQCHYSLIECLMQNMMLDACNIPSLPCCQKEMMKAAIHVAIGALTLK